MKKVIIGLAMVAITLAACNSNNNKSSASQNEGNGSQAASKIDNSKSASSSGTKNAVFIKEIVSQYLQIKNGLANDNGKEAANAGNAFVESISKMDKTALPDSQKKIWDDISDDAKEMAEHISENADKLEHQREHFELLSKDMYDLVKAFGYDQVLYKVFDPMYNNGEGAFWLSETKEIKNPYMGRAMSNSGTIQEEIK
jgi:hypothetical protein